MNIKILILLAVALSLAIKSIAKTKLPAVVRFAVSAPAKEIKGACSTAQVWMDKSKGTIEAIVPIDSISFENNFTSGDNNDIIRDRFRTYYMESATYPLISFKGSFLPDSLRQSMKDSSVTLRIKGLLSIHGVTKNIEVEASTLIKNGKQILAATIRVEPNLFGIRLPAYIGRMYFKEVTIYVEAQLI